MENQHPTMQYTWKNNHGLMQCTMNGKLIGSYRHHEYPEKWEAWRYEQNSNKPIQLPSYPLFFDTEQDAKEYVELTPMGETK